MQCVGGLGPEQRVGLHNGCQTEPVVNQGEDNVSIQSQEQPLLKDVQAMLRCQHILGSRQTRLTVVLMSGNKKQM